jgi:flagellin
MPLTVSNNSAVAAASYYLGKNQQALQMSIKKLASGKRLIAPNADPGTLSVSMKLNASVTRLVGAKNNVQNGISFVEVQDGMLNTAGRIVGRMAELKGMATQDPMKSAQDVASYDNEFRDLQVQLYQISQQTFNGVSLFANVHTKDADPTVTANEAVFGGANQSDQLDHTISIYTSSNGSSGTRISIHKSLLLSALTLSSSGTMTSAAFSTATNTTSAANADAVFSFAASIAGDAMSLDRVSAGVFEQALSNIAFLRAQNGGAMSRLSFSAESIAAMETNLRAAVGRIEDVDIAEESANLAKYSILTQAAAAMVAQANTTNDVALILLR